MIHSTYHLLAACARAECDPAQQHHLVHAAEQVTTWDALPTQAQMHGLAPLAYRHLRAANVTLPRTVQRDLNALAIQSRLASQTNLKVLGEIVREYQAAGIRVLMLKGAALNYLLYPEPGLRPMRDLDLLVSRADLERAQLLLGEMGFSAPMTFAGRHAEHRHLSAATLHRDGYVIEVELHHNLFEPGASPILMGLPDLTCPPISFSLGTADLVGWTLGYADMLWHLCQHLVESTNVFSSVNLIWVADIVSFAERFQTQIDWAQVKRQYPIVLSTLALLHFLTPLSGDLVRRAQLTLGLEPPGMWDDFQKSPRTTPEDQMHQDYRQTLHHAANPSAWWLRLHYGLGSARPLRWHHWLAHWMYLARRLIHVRRRQARLRES